MDAAAPDIRQQQFAEEFSQCLNLTEAYRRVYGDKPHVHSDASKLARIPTVAQAITKLLTERRERTQVKADRLVLETAIVAFSDITHYGFTEDGHVCLTPDAPRDAMKAVASIKRKPVLIDGEVRYEVEIRLWGKNEAQNNLAKLIGAFPKESSAGEDAAAAFRVTLTDMFAAQARARAQLQLEGQKLVEVVDDAQAATGPVAEAGPDADGAS